MSTLGKEVPKKSGGNVKPWGEEENGSCLMLLWGREGEKGVLYLLEQPKVRKSGWEA